jgi:hypothetical protein
MSSLGGRIRSQFVGKTRGWMISQDACPVAEARVDSCRLRLDYSIFDPGVYRNHVAKWHFHQENATFNRLETLACGSKML